MCDFLVKYDEGQGPGVFHYTWWAPILHPILFSSFSFKMCCVVLGEIWRKAGCVSLHLRTPIFQPILFSSFPVKVQLWGPGLFSVNMTMGSVCFTTLGEPSKWVFMTFYFHSVVCVCVCVCVGGGGGGGGGGVTKIGILGGGGTWEKGAGVGRKNLGGGRGLNPGGRGPPPTPHTHPTHTPTHTRPPPLF